MSTSPNRSAQTFDEPPERSTPTRSPKLRVAHPEGRRRDQEFVSRIRRGDPLAFSDLYEAHRDRVQRYILSRVNNLSEAEDLTQETFLQAFRSIDAFEGRSSLLSWLIGIARHTCLRYFRYNRRWIVNLPHSDCSGELVLDPKIEHHVDAIRTLDRCDSLLADLRGAENHSIFHQRYSQHKPIRAIASDLGKSRDAVKASLRRSRQMLSKNLRDAYPPLSEIA